MDESDKLIILIKALRALMSSARDQLIFIEYPSLALDIDLDVDTVKSLLPAAAKEVGLQISQSGQDSAMLKPIPKPGLTRIPFA